MKLVEGDYCTEVAHKCLKSWYDKSNKKTICEEFEPGSARCVGEEGAQALPYRHLRVAQSEGRAPRGDESLPPGRGQARFRGQAHVHRVGVDAGVRGPGDEAVPLRVHARRGQVQRRPPLGRAQHEEGRRSATPTSSPACGRACAAGHSPTASATMASPTCPPTQTRWWQASSSTAAAQVQTACTPGAPGTRACATSAGPKIYTHNEDFYYYFLSSRCCGEPDDETHRPAYSPADGRGGRCRRWSTAHSSPSPK